ncbi:Predicted signal transduction protein [hydrothermal vent metagenome]|uniref:Predicted signal transduction protein n=1 Tax=hydrothermal vent metagenome TaxID=652676 RepID=A0A3B0Z8V1_9ZZZZ
MTPQDLVSRNVRLVSLPEVCLQVQALTDSPHTTAEDIGAMVGKDAALTTRLLKLVNSAFFSLPQKIDTVTRAVNLIGMRELRNLTMAASAAEVFSHIPGSLIDMAAFWQHSVYSALVARNLAQRCNVLHSERLFTAGLLHDIGRLLMLTRLPDEIGKAESIRQCSDKDICEIETNLMGFDHAEVGHALLTHWNMPENLCASVLYHHNPGEAHDAHLEAALLHIADFVTHCAQESKDPLGSPFYDPYGALLDSDLSADDISAAALDCAQDEAFELTKISHKDIVDAIGKSATAFSQVLDLLYPMAWETPR